MLTIVLEQSDESTGKSKKIVNDLTFLQAELDPGKESGEK